MRIKEIHNILQELKDGKVTQNDIAKAIETSRANVSKLFSKNSYINDEKIQKIEEYFSVKLISTNDMISVEYFPDKIVTGKNGKWHISEKHVNCLIPKTFFNVKPGAKYIMCHANDNSMKPLIMCKDFVIIEKSESKEIINNKIYAFIYEGELYIRRLSNNISQYVVIAENNVFQTQYISKNDDNYTILGRIIYVGRVADF